MPQRDEKRADEVCNEPDGQRALRVGRFPIGKRLAGGPLETIAEKALGEKKPRLDVIVAESPPVPCSYTEALEKQLVLLVDTVQLYRDINLKLLEIIAIRPCSSRK